MKRSVVFFCLLAFIFTAGCAAQMSTKAKATMLLATYNSMTHRTMTEANLCWQKGDACTEAQRIVIRKKKAIIQQMDPMIKAYGVAVEVGSIPSVDDEQALYDFIDELVLLSP